MIKEGRATPKSPRIAPRTPLILYPMKVQLFIAKAPGKL